MLGVRIDGKIVYRYQGTLSQSGIPKWSITLVHDIVTKEG
jgi:hypothetical protein